MSEAIVETSRKKFRNKTYVSIIINADIITVWNVLVDLNSFPEWTKTIISTDGQFSKGNIVTLKEKSNTNKHLKLKVNQVVAKHKILCTNQIRKRNFRLKKINSQTLFYMSDTMRLPFILPKKENIDTIMLNFEDFANDLKKVSEQNKH